MKIDYETLRRCNNCRFEAKNADEPVYGDIHVMNSGEIAFFYSPEGVATEQRLFPSCNGHRYIEYAGREKFEFFFSLKFSDFKITPRNPETYQDWQVGDELTDKSHDGVYTVVFRCGEVVLYKYRVGDSRYLIASLPYTCEELFDKGYRLVLTDIETQIVEEEKAVAKPHEFKKYDPVLVRDVDGSCWIPAVFKQMCPLLPRPFWTIDGTGWKQCVPLNDETVGCLGTTQKIPNQCGKE